MCRPLLGLYLGLVGGSGELFGHTFLACNTFRGGNFLLSLWMLEAGSPCGIGFFDAVSGATTTCEYGLAARSIRIAQGIPQHRPNTLTGRTVGDCHHTPSSGLMKLPIGEAFWKISTILDTIVDFSMRVGALEYSSMNLLTVILSRRLPIACTHCLPRPIKTEYGFGINESGSRILLSRSSEDGGRFQDMSDGCREEGYN